MAEDRTRIIGRIIRCRYSNDNFSIVVVENSENGEEVNIKGYNLPDDGFTYAFEGKLSNNSEYGPTLDCEFYQLFTSSKSDIIKYMSKNIDGVGTKTAQKLFDVYGPEEVLDALKDKEKLFVVVKSQKKVDRIYKSACEQLIDKEFYFKMMKYDIPLRIIGDVANNLDDPNVVFDNPFILTRFGVSFQKCNKIAITNKVKLVSNSRIGCAIRFYLKEEIASKGHLFVPYEELVKKVLNILNKEIEDEKCFCKKTHIDSVLRKMTDNRSIKLQRVNGRKLVIYDGENYQCEIAISRQIINRVRKMQMKQYTAAMLKPYIEKYERRENVHLSEQQKLAVQYVMNYDFCCITGSAGTGKTTVLKFCIEIFKELFNTEEICLLAPTGRAARRMAEKTNMDASTIHSRLGIMADGAVQSELDERVVFVDEVSMVGNSICYKLLDNSSSNTRFVFLGDPQQLPSVESGNILSDIIASGVVPVVKLDVIYRQCKESLIVSNANRITKGNTNFQEGDDFVFVNQTGSQEILKKVVETFRYEFFKRVKDLNEVQIITPMRERGYLSAKSINLAIQESINPRELRPDNLTVQVNGYEFRLYDKVICQKNSDTVKNGEIGNITGIYCDREKHNEIIVEIDFYGSPHTFTKDDLKELNFALGYACTVHKAQGSEFRSVILPVSNENKIMLKRNLLYTAVTRASEKMIIVGSKIHYFDAVRNNVVEPRNTLLASRLRKFYLEE